MTTQEKLEAFAPYLPYRLNCQWLRKDDNQLIVSDLTLSDYQFLINKNNGKPAFHPLSDLIKPHLEGGKTPIVELAKIAEPTVVWFLDVDGYCKSKVNKTIFTYGGGCFYFNNKNSYKVIKNQTNLFKQLYKWHFWLGDQSEFGKSIIDINTLKTE